MFFFWSSQWKVFKNQIIIFSRFSNCRIVVTEVFGEKKRVKYQKNSCQKSSSGKLRTIRVSPQFRTLKGHFNLGHISNSCCKPTSCRKRLSWRRSCLRNAIPRFWLGNTTGKRSSWDRSLRGMGAGRRWREKINCETQICHYRFFSFPCFLLFRRERERERGEVFKRNTNR